MSSENKRSTGDAKMRLSGNAPAAVSASHGGKTPDISKSSADTIPMLESAGSGTISADSGATIVHSPGEQQANIGGHDRNPSRSNDSAATGVFTPSSLNASAATGDFTPAGSNASAATGDFTPGAANASAATGDFTSAGSASAATGDFTPGKRDSWGASKSDDPDSVATQIGSVQPRIDPSTGRAIPQITGYVILGELGRGGMGVVYKARQRALNRLVAIKMVLAGGHAGSEQLARFHLEAEAVAALKHPNIVQIYEVGECDSLPYFSLEFVDGSPMDKMLGGKPLAFSETARLMEILARAMHFAHEQGIVHRDLKPANVLLTTDGIPKITDFGLAKKLDDDSSQTKSGTLMGTPSYMAPEQARGEFKGLGPQADVHSLGAMMYEMLVGRPPFLGASPVETIMQVIKQEPVPPSRLIQKLPPDLETICLKCLQKEPEKRYATASALAEDLRRYLADEPILSRPISSPERLWRWCRRNPRLAGLAATVAGLLVTVAVTSTVSAIRIADERNLKEEQRKAAVQAELLAEARKAEADDARKLAEQHQAEAEAAKIEADANSKVANDQAGLALTTMQLLIDKVQTQLQDAPNTQKLKRDLLETAMEGLKQVAKKAEGSTSIEATMLAAHMRMGNMFRQLGSTEDAMHEFTRSYEIAERRAKENPDNDAAQGNLAAVLTVLGDMHQALRRDMSAALDCYEKVLDIRQRLFDKPPSESGKLNPIATKQSLAEALTRVGVTSLRFGNPQKAIPYFEKALQFRTELAEAQPDSEPMQQDLARSYNALGEVSFLSGDNLAARKYYDQCLKLRADMLATKPDSARFQAELAGAAGNYGDLCLKIKDLDAAKKLYSQAVEYAQKLATLDEQNIDYQRSLGTAFYRLGVLATRDQNPEEAAQQFQRCLELRRKIADLDSKNTIRQMELMLVLARTGDTEHASEIAEAIRMGKKDRESLFEVARCYSQCAAAAAETPSEAAAFANQAIVALGDAIAEGYSDKVGIESEPDLDPIRNHPEYAVLLGKLPVNK